RQERELPFARVPYPEGWTSKNNLAHGGLVRTVYSAWPVSVTRLIIRNDLGGNMKAVQINNFGGPQEITTGEAALNDLQPGEVLVRVEAASVNPLDLKMLAGYMQEFFPIAFPYIPGTDFSGLVESVGSDVTSLKPGDQVVGRTTPNLG